MKFIKDNRTIAIIALIAIVNAIGYGIVIPVLYSYSRKYGLSDFQNGLLFALFSIFQFLSTPIIGRLSDKYGRRPLLIASLSGTALSFFIMAFAPNAIFLFLARALDGITAGNIPVASAVISDTTTPENRAKGFGIIGASFGFGFIFGPAVSALTVGYSLSMPFIIAGVVSVLAVIFTVLYLPESNKHIGQVAHNKLFDFGKLVHWLKADKVGPTLWLSFLYSFAFAMLIYSYQPYAVKTLNLNPVHISLLFTMFGVVGLIAQLGLIGRLTKRYGVEKTMAGSLIMVSVMFILMFAIQILPFFVIISALFGLSNAPVQPLTQTILSHLVGPKEQGEMQGINASYMSIGQILGPIAGGALATLGITYPFLAGGIVTFICFLILNGAIKKDALAIPATEAQTMATTENLPETP